MEKLIVGVGIAAIIGCIWLSIEEHKQWEEFKAAHACKIVAKVRGEVLTTVGSDSKGNAIIGTTTTADKTGWLCDDGITYYR